MAFLSETERGAQRSTLTGLQAAEKRSLSLGLSGPHITLCRTETLRLAVCLSACNSHLAIG